MASLAIFPLKNSFGDALDAETPVDDRVFGFVLIGDALKMLLEQKLGGR